MDTGDFDFKQKLLVLGANGVGKSTITSIAQSRKDEAFIYRPTIGLDYGVYYGFTDNGKKMKLSIWDASGDQKFAPIVRSYLGNADACLLVYDVNNADTFKDLDFWMELIKTCYQFQFIEENNTEKYNYPPIYLVGTKIDLKKENKPSPISEEKINQFLEKHHLPSSFSYQINATLFNEVNHVMMPVVNHLYHKNIEKITLVDNSRNKSIYSSLNLPRVNTIDIASNKNKNRNQRDPSPNSCCQIL